MVEFDWIFMGDSAKLFVDALANSRSEVMFEVKTLQVAIRYLWGFHFYRLLWIVFVPYVIFFLVFLVYSTILYEGPDGTQYKDGRLACAIICFIYSAFALYQETKQMVN